MLSAKIDIERGRIILPRYLFPARKTRVLDRQDIVEVMDWFPPAILMKTGELLFVSRDQLEELTKFCDAHAVSITGRYDVWADLLEPFLDTKASREMQAVTLQRLRERGGLTADEIETIRETVGRKMMTLTSQTWEWQHYSLFDVLLAMKPKLPFGGRKWTAFYAEAMALAQRSLDTEHDAAK